MNVADEGGERCAGDVGISPGGLTGVRRVGVVGIGGIGYDGGGDWAGPLPAYGLVTYEDSEVIEGIASRRPATLR